MLSILISSLLITPSWAQNQCESALLPSRSQQYAHLEPVNDESTAFLRAQNQRQIQDLKGSPNLKAVEEWMWDAYNKVQIKDVEDLSSDEARMIPRSGSGPQVRSLSGAVRLKLISRGLGKPTELVLDNKGQEKVLFSNFNYKRNSSVSFMKFEVSPKKDYVLMFFYENGSTDRYWIQVLDLRTGKAIGDKIVMSSAQVAWLTDTQFFLSIRDDKAPPIYDIKTATYSQSATLGDLYNSWGPWSLYQGGVNGRSRVLVKTNGKPEILADTSVTEIIFADEAQILFMATAPSGFEQVVRRDLKNHTMKVLIPEAKRVISRVDVIDSNLFVWSMMGADRKIEVFSSSGEALTKLQIPLEINVRNIERTSRSNVFQMSLSSSIQKLVTTKWTLGEELPWEKLQTQMMTDTGFEAKTILAYAKSADGTQLPVRLVMRKDLSRDGKNVSYIESYGGFSLPGYFEPKYDLEIKEFIRRGGIYVAPMIRGGNDLGPDWHTQAQGAKRLIKSAEDLVAVADFLAENNYSKPSLVASTGTSNGGRLVALAGLLSPQSFGLVIPINGVHDLLGKEYLDKAFGNGWSYEFGDSRIPEDRKYLSKISGVEMDFKSRRDLRTKFFVVNGQNDSRVHPAHSRKLQASISDQSGDDSSLLMALKNSGHWMGSVNYQNLIGWRTQSSIWTRVYDLAGWDLSKEDQKKP